MIRNLHFLIDPEASPDPKVRKVEVSRHVVQNKAGTRKWVFGWDQPLHSFYLQVHDLTRPEDDEENPRIVVWLGADAETEMYEVEHLVQAAREHGLAIDHSYQMVLYGEKDDGV